MLKFIDEVTLRNKKILVRVDFNVSLDPRHQIGNDERIRQVLPTLNYLLQGNNTLILISHLGRPTQYEKKLSLAPVAHRLQQYIDSVKIELITDLSSAQEKIRQENNSKTIFLLENIRFYEGERKNSAEFVKQLASLGEIYVNDAFSVSHRSTASIVGLPALLPSYAGLLFKKEITMISRLLKNPKKPFLSILGGAKISTKINLLEKLCELSETVLLGGALANTFLAAQGYEMGQSLFEEKEFPLANKLLRNAVKNNKEILLPVDFISGNKSGEKTAIKTLSEVNKNDHIFDIGPQTQAIYGSKIMQAKTILWNGPVGFFEVNAYRRGTDFIYYAIAQNEKAVSLVGGGETLAALSNKEHLEKITHISTGGGAMLSFLENNTLVGIEALEKASVNLS